ncbi:ABC transporter permease [Rhodococcus sp. BP-149]|uniref:ABC transporter permease n=1 Tax=unclassified Rhodococcus (in: high G+C Gram-positive bacteria) TaxID=192944 RepID=UPI001C9B7D1A|nr:MULTISPECIES: ABC transporter permease [unclassified Rhodococcus (in: high G+C Gram-positive bacteria)]MBY6685829.1 ABC transporter permease [Rhodococcus sp. BP-288]MBY6694623.1 ABC transporter permease [Rhodococcus sp. BP-188]MBY6699393.1 ABC transporter permease [Rhodococcus sp. BP-285]MBY6703001.1 ABC transporter permease [Rhodococcus sp. BP-283]MBY6711419.1 ABC transporter permease [Rhodococcus sp. BP-160]
MTTALDTPTAPARDRIVSVMRVQTHYRTLAFAWPLGILAVIVGITWAVLSLVPDGSMSIKTGGATFVFIFGLTLFAQILTQVFPFTLGLGVTRREFFAATVAVAVVHALMFGIGLFALSLVESATDGFGVRMQTFSLVTPLAGSAAIELLFLIAAFLMCNLIGMLAGAIYLRWRVTGIWTAVLAEAVLIGAVIFVVTWQGWWGTITETIADAPRLSTMVLLPLLVASAAGLGTHVILRRTTA